MDPNELTVTVRALDGEWETLGSESARYRGIVPENVQFSADQWGSSTCSFELRRDPGSLHPDLAAFTECEIWVAGLKCWSGRVKETPTREGTDPVISVQGQGWQYHLDDDLYKRTYVRTRLDGWADMRSLPDAILAENKLAAAGQVSIDGQALTLTFPSGGLYYTGTTVGCYLDLGPEEASWAKAVNLELTTSNNTAGVLVYVRCSSSGPDNNAGWVYCEDVLNSPLTTLGPTYAYYADLSTARRWVQLFIHFPGGAGGPTGADHWARFSTVGIFSETTYHSAGAPVLKADAVVRDAASKATLKLSDDLSRIGTGTFNIPEFEMSGYQTPREVITAVNAFENYETKVDVERRMVFIPRQTAPAYEIGEWSGAEFEDASANSGEEIINRVIVQGTGAGGEAMSVERWQSSGETTVGITQIPNPDATVDATGWTLIAGAHASFTRSTAEFTTSPASFRSQGGTNAIYETASVTQPFARGERYAVSAWFHAATVNLYHTWSVSVLVDGVQQTIATRAQPRISGGAVDPTWYKVTASWVQKATGAAYKVRIHIDSGSWFDEVRMVKLQPTVVDRQGFVRTRVMPVQNRVTLASAERLGDLYLAQHMTTPFTGGFKATGVGGVRRVLGGTSIHPAWLAKDTGELVRVGHVIDPDTGAIGRDERIAAVTYDHNAQTATVSLSEDRGGFDALLQRLAAVVK